MIRTAREAREAEGAIQADATKGIGALGGNCATEPLCSFVVEHRAKGGAAPSGLVTDATGVRIGKSWMLAHAPHAPLVCGAHVQVPQRQEQHYNAVQEQVQILSQMQTALVQLASSMNTPKPG